MQERLETYTADGQPTGRTIFRGDRLEPGEYRLVVQIWIRNATGAYLIQQRSEQLDHLPGVWATTAGHVLAGEEARTGAIRELDEEIGLNIDPQALRHLFTQVGRRTLSSVWLLEQEVAIEALTLQAEEVSAALWADQETIEAMIQDKRFFDYGDTYLKAVFNAR